MPNTDEYPEENVEQQEQWSDYDEDINEYDTKDQERQQVVEDSDDGELTGSILENVYGV